ncbi:MAG: GC-type dockerin domain-anchored protein [Phycisphaerales bacterium]
MRLSRSVCPMLPLLALAGLASGATVQVTVVIGPPSSIDLELCQDLPVVSGCDSDSSPLVGTAILQIDETASTVVLVDFSVATSESLDYHYSGLLSGIDATAPTATVVYEGVGPTAPAPIVAGNFSIPDVPVNLVGTAYVTGTILAVGTVDETIDLSTFGPFNATLTGTLTPTLTGYALDGGFSFMETTTGEVLGITVTTNANGTLVIAGEGDSVPAACNPADINADGVLNLDDINAFATAFVGADLAADVDHNGTLNLDDINTFASAFLAGCP